MKKRLVAEEYTLYCSGDIQGFVIIRKDEKWEISITPNLPGKALSSTKVSAIIYNSICPLIPAQNSFELLGIDSIIIDGNTTTETNSVGGWVKKVVDGNTTMWTHSDGRWEKTVVDGDTTTVTKSNGDWEKAIVDGNTTTVTCEDGSWKKNGGNAAALNCRVHLVFQSVKKIYFPFMRESR